jgi:hypothetical protein
MEYDFTKFKEMWNTKDCSLNNTIISVSGLYNGVCCAIDELREQEFHGGDLAEILQTLETRFGSSEIGNVESQRAGISNLVTELSNLLEHDNECIYHHDALGLRYLESAREFTEWLSSSFPALSGLEEEYVDALYKILGIEIGRLLGEYSAWALLNEAPESNISKLDRCLSRNTL